MNPFASYRLLITPLSPIHVGTGESYEPTNYVIEDGVLHEFDTGAVMQAFTAADRTELLAIGNRRPNTQMLEALQGFFFERRNALIGHAIQRIPVLPGVERFYAKRIGQAGQLKADGTKDLNKMEIDRTSFNPVTRIPVLFGSSIKGAIRTALLDKVNGGAGLSRVADRRTGKRREENNQELQQRLFQYRAGKFELDPMRLIQLADAVWAEEPGMPAAHVCLAVNRKKAPVVDTQGILRKSRADELYQILECVPGWRYRAFAGQLTVQSVAGLDNHHRDKLPAAELRFDMGRVALACNAFYRSILDAEIRLMRERGYLDDTWDQAVQQFFEENAERLRRGDTFLLRVGRHSGAESVTLNGVRDGHIKIMLDKDPATKKQRFAYESEARTLWLAANDKDQMQNLLPFGWLLVEVHDIDAPAPDWPELKAACEPHLVEARRFANRLEVKEAEIEQARQEAETRRQAEEEEARQRTEAAQRQAQAEAERQSRLATLSPNQRRIEEFAAAFVARAEQLRGKLDRQNTDYHQRAQKLAKDALEGTDWTSEERRAAAYAIAKWLPKVVERVDKDTLKKLKLGVLRGNP